MSAIEDVAASREGLNKTIHDLKEAQLSLEKRGDNLDTNLSAKVDDLKASVRGLHSAVAAYNASNDRPDGSDADLCRYLESDAEELRHNGTIDTKSANTGRRKPYFANDNKAVRLVGVTRADGSYDSGLLDDPKPRTEWQRELQDMVDARSFVRSIQGSRRAHTPMLDRKVLRHLANGPGTIGKIFADSSGIGAEWIPDNTLPTLERELLMARRIESLFGTVTIPAGGSMVLPFLTTGLRPYKAGAATTDDPAQFSSSSLTTASRTFTAVKLAARMQVDRDASEDSIVGAIQVGREELVGALVDGSEDAIINGDATASHQDTGLTGWNIRSRWGASGLGGTADHRRLWTGLRARATDVSNTNDAGSTQTTAGFGAAIASLDSPHGMGDVVAVTSPEYMLVKMLLLAEVLTVDKYGANATVLTGELGRLLGKPIFISEFVDNAYTAAGIYDDSSKVKTGLLVFNRARFWMAVRRGARLEAETDITRDLDNFVITERKVFATFDSSTKKNVRWDYNLSIA